MGDAPVSPSPRGVLVAPPPAPPAPAGTATPPGGRPRRPRSIFSGLLLIAVGALLLAAQLRPEFDLSSAISHFWPLVLILWGLAKLIDHFPGGSRGPLVTVGEIGLLIGLLCLAGVVVFSGWVRDRVPGSLGRFGFLPARYSMALQASARPLTSNGRFTVTTADGDIDIRAGNADEAKVQGTATTSGATEEAARDRMKDVSVAVGGTNGDYQIHPVSARGGISVDLNVALPAAARVVAQTQHGGVSLAGVRGAASVSARNGEVQAHDLGGDLTANLQGGDAYLRDVAGALQVSGRSTGSVEIANIGGAVTIDGNFYGNLEARGLAKGIRYISPRATISAAQLPGDLKIDARSIEMNGAAGPVQASAQNRDMTFLGIEGPLDVNATRGDVSVALGKSPSAPIHITGDTGEINLTLPAQAKFTISATTGSGAIENDFGSAGENAERGSRSLQATYGAGGPAITITTEYGNIHIHKGN